MRKIFFVLALVCIPHITNAIEYAPTFCGTMQDEKAYVERLIHDIKGLHTGYTPMTLDQQDNATQGKQQKYKDTLENMMENIRTIAKLREETIYKVHPPKSGEEYMKCCAMTCDYLSKHKNLYK